MLIFLPCRPIRPRTMKSHAAARMRKMVAVLFTWEDYEHEPGRLTTHRSLWRAAKRDALAREGRRCR